MAKRYDINDISGTTFTYQLYANLNSEISGESNISCAADTLEPPITCVEGSPPSCSQPNANPNIRYRATIIADGQSITSALQLTKIAAANDAFSQYTTTTCETKFPATGTFRTGGVVDGNSIFLDTFVGNTDCTSIVGFGLQNVGTIAEVEI